jgi:hypothetical protein
MSKFSLVSVLFIVGLLVLVGCGRQGGEVTNINDDAVNLNEETINETVDAYNELMEDVAQTNDGKVKASCNVIAASSNCIDYVGSYWANTDYAKLNCEGTGDVAERTFSKNGCPYSEYGGCKTGVGTIMELIAWVYPEGGGEYNAENIQYAAGACNAVAGS